MLLGLAALPGAGVLQGAGLGQLLAEPGQGILELVVPGGHPARPLGQVVEHPAAVSCTENFSSISFL
ncbi:MAG: hypothetical protein R2882_09465 [Gemmatimonadales bacterium]